jgi:hypothetical protein
VKPGITCLWQVSGRNEIDFHEWMKLDSHYIDNWSFLLPNTAEGGGDGMQTPLMLPILSAGIML